MKSKIDSVKLGVTLGILVALSMLILTIVVNENNGYIVFNMIKNVYPGCSQETVLNRFMCVFFGFLDGFIGGFLIGFIYNNIY